MADSRVVSLPHVGRSEAGRALTISAVMFLAVVVCLITASCIFDHDKPAYPFPESVPQQPAH